MTLFLIRTLSGPKISVATFCMPESSNNSLCKYSSSTFPNRLETLGSENIFRISSYLVKTRCLFGTKRRRKAHEFSKIRGRVLFDAAFRTISKPARRLGGSSKLLKILQEKNYGFYINFYLVTRAYFNLIIQKSQFSKNHFLSRFFAFLC